MPKPPKDLREFQSLVEIMQALRGPDGCPWDKEQNFETLAPFAIEEACELADAISKGKAEEICEELGDLLLQVTLNAEIARQENLFDIQDVIESIASKMVRRHPHVFSDTKVSDSAEVIANWGDIKKAEGKTADPFDAPSGLPPMARAQKIGKRTENLKFDWENADDVLEQLESEIRELRQALKAPRTDPRFQEGVEHEVGDILFSAVQVARHVGVDAENSLRKTNNRFLSRFAEMNRIAKQKKQTWDHLSIEEKESLWKEAKRNTKDSDGLE